MRDDPDTIRARGLTATWSPAGVLLTNLDTVAIYFAVYDGRLLPRIERAPCTDPRSCEVLLPGARRTIAVALPVSDTAMVFGWRLIPGSGASFRADSVRAVVVAHQGRHALNSSPSRTASVRLC